MVKVYDQMRVLGNKPKDPLWGAYPSQLITYWAFFEWDPVGKRYLIEKGVQEPVVQRAAAWYNKREPLAFHVLDHEEFDFHQAVLQKSSATGYRELKKLAYLWRKYTGKEIGFYGEFPERSYDEFKDPASKQAWTDVTDVSVAMMKRELDFVAPSLYTMSKDRDAWFAFASANLEMASRFELPIKAYLWPRYYAYSNPVPEAGQLIEYDFFMAQLKFCEAQGCDIILWDDARPWLGTDSQKAILDFLNA